jgi:hypothetical protein
MEWPQCILTTKNINQLSSTIHFYREKNSHKNLSEFRNITHLLAKQVNQSFLEEISELVNLEFLILESVSAENIESLKKLKKLRYLRLDGVKKASEFSSLLEIPALKKLFIESANKLQSLDFLHDANNLSVIGVEGGMYSNQKINSLEPLSNLNELEALFLSSVQLKDKSLDYLSSNEKLKYLSSARFAPKSNFDSLRKLMPNLICKWCDDYDLTQ